MSDSELQTRTKAFALRVIRLVGALPNGHAAEVIGKQLLRSGTWVGANYRAACRAKSPSDFIAKLKTVEEEADESLYWMELLIESGLMSEQRLTPLMEEGNAIVAMTVSSIKTTRSQKPA